MAKYQLPFTAEDIVARLKKVEEAVTEDKIQEILKECAFITSIEINADSELVITFYNSETPCNLGKVTGGVDEAQLTEQITAAIQSYHEENPIPAPQTIHVEDAALVVSAAADSSMTESSSEVISSVKVGEVTRELRDSSIPDEIRNQEYVTKNYITEQNYATENFVAEQLGSLDAEEPDWNENNPESPAFINNRPFYTGDKTDIEVFNSKVKLMPSWTGEEDLMMAQLDWDYYRITEGLETTIILDGVEYHGEVLKQTIGFSGRNITYYFIGNPSLASAFLGGIEFEDTGEPFLLGWSSASFSSCQLFMKTTDSDHNLIVKVKDNPIYQIPEKYLPLTTQADWNENNPLSVAYIKNRPFYTKDPEEVEIFNSEITLEMEERDVEDPLSIDRGYAYIEHEYYDLTVGMTLIIILDGVEYRVVTQYDEDNWGYFIGNLLISDPWFEGEHSDEPFHITYEPNQPYFDIYVQTAESEHTLIIKAIETNHEIIPERYITHIAGRRRKFMGISSAEIFNDYENNVAFGDYSHAEGSYNTVLGHDSHVEGYGNTVQGAYSHAEGSNNTVSEYGSHAEGSNNTVSGGSSHVEGYNNTAQGDYSHVEGSFNTASGHSSHAEGHQTKAASEYQHVQGKHNIVDSENRYAHILGNGSGMWGDYGRSNAHTIDWNGNAWFAGKVYIGGTSMDDAQELGTANLDELQTTLASKQYVQDMILSLQGDIDEISSTMDETLNLIGGE